MKLSLSAVLLAAALGASAALAQPTPEEPRRPRRYPTAEAVEACDGRRDGDRCYFTLRDKDLEGTCHTHTDGAFVACVPIPPKPSAESDNN